MKPLVASACSLAGRFCKVHSVMIPTRATFVFGLCCFLSGVQLAIAAPAPPSDENVAIVNGVQISRAHLHQILEGTYDQQALPELIDAQLLEGALKERGLSVSDDEVMAELARVEAQDDSVKAIMELGGARLEVIRSQVRRNLTVQKLLTARVPAPTDAQLRAFFNRYSSYYGTPLQVRLGFLAASTKTRADQLSRALKAKPDSFDALVMEQKAKAAQDRIAGASTPDTGHFSEPSEFGPAVAKSLATAKKGQILPVQALAPTGPFLIVKVVDRKGATTPDFAKLRQIVETDYKLAQVAQSEIRKNPQNPQSLDQVIKQVIEYLGQSNPQTGQPGTKAGLRDALTTILRPASNNSLNYLREHAKITITDPSLAPKADSSEAVGNAEFNSSN